VSSAPYSLAQQLGFDTNRGFTTFSDPGADAHRTLDRASDTKKQRRAFQEVRRAEQSYARQLRSVAQQIGFITKGLTPRGGIPDPIVLERVMRSYSETLGPWAKTVAQRMLDDVSRRDWAVWRTMADTMSIAMQEEIKNAPTGQAMRQLLQEQVHLIQSMPIEAAQRAQKLALRVHQSGERYGSIVDQIARTGHVTKSRAQLIARTEVARAASGMVQARATFVGSEGYIWRTSQDADVRYSHKKMSGKFVRWDQPPVTDGMHGHAGQLPNCRCYPEPVLPELIQ
jgi:SPP1 gp7 family putative phage head morphogenesis protein